jgi:diguanylate cyclase (GGDEF)-like protein/PAS domain S-box-containing protein
MPRASGAIALCGIVLVVIFWAIALERIAFERGQAVAEVERSNANLALAFEEHTLRTVKAIDQAVLFIKREYETHGAQVDLAGMADAGILDPGLLRIAGVVDERGNVVHSSVGRPQLNVSGREYFRIHRERPDAGLYIGAPVTGHITGQEVIQFARRLSKPDGSFAGVVVVALEPSYFLQFYRQVDMAPQGLITLVGARDRIVRARQAGETSSAGHDMGDSTLFRHFAQWPSGKFVAAGRLEGVPRYVSYRAVRDYPLIVAVGASSEHALAHFGERRRIYLLAASLATLFVFLFGGGLLLQLRKRHAAMQAVARSEERYRAAFEQAAIGIMHTALDGRLLKVNGRLCSMLGYAEDELIGRAFADITVQEDLEASLALRDRLLTEPADTFAPVIEKRYVKKDGGVLWVTVSITVVRDARGRPEYFVTSVQDVTEAKRTQEKLEHQAHHDALTGLPNRTLFYDRLTQALTAAPRKDSILAVLTVGLDRFKAVNETLGYHVGDGLLQEAARRLGQTVRAGDTVGRLGGDEFAIILGELAKSENAGHVAQKIILAMAEPFALQGSEVYASVSIGIAVYPGDGKEGDVLLMNADAAMRRAKEVGRNTFQFYAAEMNERTKERLLLENDLRRALERREFLLYYQPKVVLASGAITGVEALLRWQHPQKGLVPPSQFVPLLEESGLIVPVGEWVIETACAQLRAWEDAGMRPVPVAVNLSARQFMHHDICGAVDRALERHRIDGRMLEVEITETDVMQHPDRAAAILHRLRGRRIRIAIDDFGTGYSSLSYLKNFPLDALKLDRSFVKGLPGDADDISITRAVISMAHSLGLKVVAEGVETEAQRAFLAAQNCDQMQGYLLSRPLPADECARLLRATAGLSAAA